MGRKVGRFGCFLLLVLTALVFPIAHAQDFPTKPVTLVIPVGAGGSHDLTARAVASVAADYLGQPIIIQLRPGGGGAIGSDLVSRAAPDGYTLLFGGPGWSTTLPAVEGRSKGPDDLVAVCRINYTAPLIIARPDAPYKTLKEMVEWARANPGKLVFGHSGPWGASDLPWKMIMKETGISSKAIPHDGGGPQLIAILGGHIDVAGTFLAQGLPHIRAGKLRPLAVTDTKRNPELPDVPTAQEEGVNVVYTMWRGILTPKGTPRPIIERLATAFKKMTEDKTVITMIRQFGDQIQYLGPDEFAKEWRAEYELHRELGKIYKK